MFLVSFKTDRNEYESVGTNNRVVINLKTKRGAINRVRKMCFKNREFKIEHISKTTGKHTQIYEGR